MKRTILFVCLLAGPLLQSNAQPKRVLLEKYTSAFCGACPNAHLIAEELAAAYPELILAFHHSSVDGMANPYSTEWRDGFGVPGTAMGMVNRSGPTANQIATLAPNWEDRILEQLHEPAYVELGMEGSYNPSTRELSIEVSGAFTQRPPAGELRLNLMITEDSVIHAGFGFDQSNYFNDVEGHPLYGLGQPIYFYPHHHVVREIVDGAWGTAGVFPGIPEPGQAYSRHYDYFVPWAWDQEKVNLVVFVSLFSADDLMERQVLNVIQQPLCSLVATAVDEPEDANPDFRVFPNPAAGKLQVELPSNTSWLRLCTLAGKTVYSATALPGRQEIDVSGLAAGLYLVRVHTDSGISVKKIIIHPF